MLKYKTDECQYPLYIKIYQRYDGTCIFFFFLYRVHTCTSTRIVTTLEQYLLALHCILCKHQHTQDTFHSQCHSSLTDSSGDTLKQSSLYNLGGGQFFQWNCRAKSNKVYVRLIYRFKLCLDMHFWSNVIYIMLNL